MHIPSPKESNVGSGRKLDVGNYLVYEISRAFFYIAYKGEIYFLNSIQILVSVKVKKHKCVIENINVHKSRSTFLSVKTLAFILIYRYQNPARYVNDINFGIK